ncbi:MAG: type IV pilus assembly protein PilM [Parcubacteria group bacterium]|jgi:type IV pilus assembly protein PilM
MSFLNKKIFSVDPEIFGVDLSDLSIKVMQLERQGKIEKIRSYAIAEIPAGYIEDGKIMNKEQVSAIIRETIKKAGPQKIKTNKVICSLPESKAFLRIISIPKIEETEAAEAVKWEMEANIPMPIEQVYYDWQFLEAKNKNKQNVLTAAVSKDIVDDFIEVLEGAGLEVYGLEVESVASARSLVKQKDDKGEKNVTLIVDLGAQRTSFIIVDGGVPYFTSSIPFSSEGINDTISKRLNITSAEAEKIKIAHGIESGIDNPVFEAVKFLLENLIHEIEKTMDFYGEINKDNSEVKNIILCGGGSNMRGLIPYMTKRLNREIELGDPWTNLRMGDKLPIVNKESSARYSTVIGLALRALDYGN